jgi:Lipocalin-like domain
MHRENVPGVDTMNRPTTLTLSTTMLLFFGILSPALAQTAKELVGTWTVVSGDTVRADGSRASTFGDNPKGRLVFTDDGCFIYLYLRGDLPKFASNNRTTGTADENKAVVQGSIATFRTYSVAGNELSLKIEHSTFPNWIGADQKRTIAVTGDELKWNNPAGSGGGTVELVLKRAPARSAN